MRKTGKAERQDLILAELRINRSIRVTELAEKFQTSAETIRRDLDELQATERLDRTHGGARFLPMGHEPSVFERGRLHLSERRQIGARMVQLLNANDVVMMDTGTTTLEVARAISTGSLPLTIITNSFAIASALGANSSIRVIIPPGDFSAIDAEVNGFETHEFIRRFNANVCIIGSSGITENAPVDANSNAVWLKRAMLSRALRTFLIADHSKFGRYALQTVCPWDSINAIVTDRQPAPEFQEIFKFHGIEVIVAAGDHETAPDV